MPMKQELTKLVKVIKMMKSGAELNLAELLGTEWVSDEKEESLDRVLDQMRYKLDEIRDFASDVYGEICGSKCIIN